MSKQETVQLYYRLMKKNEELILLAKETMERQSGLNKEIIELRKALKILLGNQKVIWEKLKEMEQSNL